MYPFIIDYSYHSQIGFLHRAASERSRIDTRKATTMETSAAVRTEYRVDGLAEPISHYTDAVRFGDILFISGVAALDEKGNVVGDDIVTQAACIFESLKKILHASGADFSDILKVTVYMTDVTERKKINPIRAKYFGDAKPASTLIGVQALAIPGMQLEIEAVVGVPAAANKN